MELIEPILYLDTNHLSRLARAPEEPDVAPLLTLLEAEQASLAISLFHIQELSNPTFRSMGEVGEVLNRVPLVWAINAPELLDTECRRAFRIALTGNAPPIIAFYGDFQGAWGAPEMERIPPSEMLRQFSMQPDMRRKIPDLADYTAQGDRLMKTQAAVMQDPHEPLRLRLRDMKLDETAGGLVLPQPYPPDEIIEKAGGLEAFPAYNVFQQLAVTRLGDEPYATERNDPIDEWHALYSPYVSVTVLDRRTVGRCRSAKLPHVDRITHRLGEVPELLGL